MLVPLFPGHVTPRDVYERQDAANPTTVQVLPPPASPSPSAAHPDGTPRIAGSEGAFIGLLVALSLIFLLSSIAIFFLLRNHEPTDRDRDRRRQHSIRRPGASHTLPIGMHSRDCTLTQKLGNMFRGRRAGGGWVQAGGDEWDSGDEDAPRAYGAEWWEDMRVRASEESKRARVVESDGSVTEDGRIASPINFASYSAHAQVPSRDSMAHSQDSADFQAAHASHSAPATVTSARQLFTDSANEVPTFAGGTKFKEVV